MSQVHTLEHQLLHTLSNAYTLLIMSQDIHWNATGAQFYALHEMTESHYTTLFENIDIIAEHMRTKTWHVPVGLDAFHKNSDIIFVQHSLTSEASYIKKLVEAYDVAIQQLETAMNLARQDDFPDTDDMLIGVLRTYKKHMWMLRSSH